MARRGPALGLLCHHEAGHAVARLALDERLGEPGPPILRVVVRPRAEWGTPYVGADGVAHACLGIVEGDPRVPLWQLEDPAAAGRREAIRPDVTADMLENIAGPAADLRWQVRMERAHVVPRLMQELGRTHYLTGPGNEGDMEYAARRARYLAGPDGDASALLREAWDKACELVNGHWEAIAALARRLRAQAAVAGEEVEAIVAAAMPGAFPLLLGRVAKAA
jgi:hypothetical protein